MSDFPERPRSWEGLAGDASNAATDAPDAPAEPADAAPHLTPVPAVRTVYDADPNAGYQADTTGHEPVLHPSVAGLHEAPAEEQPLYGADALHRFPVPQEGDVAAPETAVPHVAVPEASATAARAVWKEEIIAWCKTLVSAAVYATLIVTFGFQVARVEGYSMSPTLEDQDRLIVNKLAYRLGSPRRNDIVMLYYPKDPDKSFVKRVIAEEGDTVKIEDGRVFVNDVPMADDFVPPDNRGHDDWPPRVVEDGYYFVMGDNRINSSDSRHWGEVPKKYILGRVQLRWWPIPSARLF